MTARHASRPQSGFVPGRANRAGRLARYRLTRQRPPAPRLTGGHRTPPPGRHTAPACSLSHDADKRAGHPRTVGRRSRGTATEGKLIFHDQVRDRSRHYRPAPHDEAVIRGGHERMGGARFEHCGANSGTAGPQAGAGDATGRLLQLSSTEGVHP